MVLGYFVAEAYVMGLGPASVAVEIPGNIFQVVFGGVVGISLSRALRKILPSIITSNILGQSGRHRFSSLLEDFFGSNEEYAIPEKGGINSAVVSGILQKIQIHVSASDQDVQCNLHACEELLPDMQLNRRMETTGF